MLMVFRDCPLDSKSDAKRRLAEVVPNISRITDTSVTSKEKRRKCKKKKSVILRVVMKLQVCCSILFSLEVIRDLLRVCMSIFFFKWRSRQMVQVGL